MPKKVLMVLPPGLLEQVDSVALAEHRNRSDLVREALRRYIQEFERAQTSALKSVSVIKDKTALLTASAD